MEAKNHDFDSYLDGTEEGAAAFAALSPEEQARIFAGSTIEGDTGQTDTSDTPEGSATPDAATDQPATQPPADETQPAANDQKSSEPAPEADTPAEGEKSVVLAKDGKHTIPFEALVEARERAARAEAILDQLREQQQQVAAKPESQAQPEAFDLSEAEKQYLDLMQNGDEDGALKLRTQINRFIFDSASKQAAQQALQTVSEREALYVYDAAVSKVMTDYPFLNDNEAAQKDVAEWRDFYVMKGESDAKALEIAAAKVAPFYAPAQEQKQVETLAPAAEPAKPDQATLTQAAAKAVEKAKPATPKSLSEIPTAAAAPHDEIAAMRDMGSMDLVKKLHGKTPDQIMDMMNRLI